MTRNRTEEPHVQIYRPDGAVGSGPHALAPPVPVLTGKRIGVLDNGKPHARLLMVQMAEHLAKRSGATVTVVTDKGRGHNAATPCSDQVLDTLVKEADLIITGSAD